MNNNIKIRIEDLSLKNIDDLSLCLSREIRENPLFKRGIAEKKAWAQAVIEKGLPLAKIAYLDSEPVGLIQYRVKPDEEIVWIDCIYVRGEKNQRKGIGKALLQSLIRDVRKPIAILNGKPPRALVTYAFETKAGYPQHLFYLKMGFKKVSDEDPHLLYLPFEAGYVYKPKDKVYKPIREDEGKAVILYFPDCPFSYYFADKMRSIIREVAPNIPGEIINTFEKPEEAEKRNSELFACIVNMKQIKTFVADEEAFKREVREACSNLT